MTLLELLQLLKKHLKLVIILPLACALIVGGYFKLTGKTTYTSTTSLYVSVPRPEGSDAGSSYLTETTMAAGEVAALPKSNRVTKAAAQDVHKDSLDKYTLSATNTANTHEVVLTVTGPEAQETADVANAVAKEMANVAQDSLNVDKVEVLDEATPAKDGSGPKMSRYLAVAVLAGLFAAIAIVVIADMLDTRVKTVEEVEELLDLPVIGQVPVVREGR